MVGQIKAAMGHRDLMEGLFPARALEVFKFVVNPLLVAAVVDVGEFEEDQAEHRSAVFACAEVRIGAQVVGRKPKGVLELFELVPVHLKIFRC